MNPNPSKTIVLSSGHRVTLEQKHGVWFWIAAPGISFDLRNYGDTEFAVIRYAMKNRLTWLVLPGESPAVTTSTPEQLELGTNNCPTHAAGPHA